MYLDMPFSDENLYDIYLHKRDVSFTLPQLFTWLKDAGQCVCLCVSRIGNMQWNYLFKDHMFPGKGFKALILGRYDIYLGC